MSLLLIIDFFRQKSMQTSSSLEEQRTLVCNTFGLCCAHGNFVFVNAVAIDLIVQHIKDILAGNIDIRRKPPRPSRRIRRQSDSLLARPH